MAVLTRRRVLGLTLVLALVAAAAVVVVLRARGSSSCGAELVGDPSSPLQDVATMAERPNTERDETAGAVGEMEAPFGEVVAGVDYYYEQWLHLYGVPGGVLAWTKNNAPVTYLDGDDLAPRWSLKPEAKRTAWDVSDDDFLLLDLADDADVTVSTYDLGSGRAGWCVALPDRHRAGEPVATTFTAGGDVVTALPRGTGIGLTRLAAADGQKAWSKPLGTAGRADFLGMLDDRLLLVGGTEEFRLAEPPTAIPSSGAEDSVTAVDVTDGSTQWTWGAGSDGSDGGAVHVVGTAEGTVLVTVRTPTGTELVALDDTGEEQWRTPVADGGFEATLRGGVVLTRSSVGLDAYEVATGERRWHTDLPQDRTYFPYGFALGQAPSLDEDRVLLATTTSLDALDLTDGTTTVYPLPTDGVATTYWPYQLLATPEHLGVLTNTGAIIAVRE